MTKKYIQLLLLFSVKVLIMKAQTIENKDFKPRFALSTNVGLVIPLGRFSDKNSIGNSFSTVLDYDFLRHAFVRFTWDSFQFEYSKKEKIGNRIVDVNGANNGNAYYLSSGYYTDINKWKLYSFVGMGYITINDPKLNVEAIDNTSYAYLTNQNSASLSLNFGLGVGFKISSNEKMTLEANVLHLPNIADKITYATTQIGYRLFFTQSKNP
jgi:hypothetical protein